MVTSKTRMPSTDELHENEVSLQFTGGPDRLGRYQFFAYWLNPTKPDGVAGQAFNMDLVEFLQREESKGRIVVGVDNSDVEILAPLVRQPHRDPTYGWHLDELA